MPTMVALTSEKSRLIRPGVTMMSLMPCTAWRSRSSATLKDSKKLVPRGTRFSRRSLGIAITVSTVPARRPRPSSARRMRRGPSKPNGLVTTATVSASSSLASDAITGAAPVPVPPPSTGGDEHHVRALQQLHDGVGIFERGLPADVGIGPGTQAVGDLRAELQLVGHLARGERLRVRIHGVELDAFEPFRHHAGHGIASAAADADHFDPRAGARFFFHFVLQIVHVAIDHAIGQLLLLTSTSSQPGCVFFLQLDLLLQFRRIHRQARRGAPFRIVQLRRPILMPSVSPKRVWHCKHLLGRIAQSGQLGAGAR